MVNQNTGGEQQPYITNTSLPYPTYQAEKKDHLTIQNNNHI